MKYHLFIVFCIGFSVFYKVSFCYGECEDPVKKNNLRFSRIDQSEVRFWCKSGYVLLGNQTSFCENGQWNPSGQFCDVYVDVPEGWMGCGSPGSPSNGSRWIEKLMENKLHYACDKGLTQIGESERTCQPDGTWAPHISKCVENLALNKKTKHEPYNQLTAHSTDGETKTCKAQTTNFYGSVDFEKRVSFDNIQFIFNKEHSNEMHIFVTNHSDVTNNNFRNTKSLLNICNKTYEETQSQQITIESIVARYLVIWFKKQASICEIIVFNSKGLGCGKPDAPLHGKTLKYDSKVATYECNPGYSMNGEKEVHCEHGVWNLPPPKCLLPQVCPPGPPPPRTSTRLISSIPIDYPQNKNYEDDSNKTTIALGVVASLASLSLIFVALYYKLNRNHNFKNRENDSQKHFVEHEEYEGNAVDDGNDANATSTVNSSQRTSADIHYVELEFPLP